MLHHGEIVAAERGRPTALDGHRSLQRAHLQPWCQAQRCVAALGVAGKVERPDQEPEDFEGGLVL